MRCLWFALGLLLPLTVVAQGPPSGSRGRPPTVTLAVNVSVKLGWDYPTGVANHAGFQVLRCDLAGGQSTCPPSTGISGMIAVSERTAVDATGEAGKGYCWAVRAIAVSGPNSDPSNSHCETLPSVVVTPPPVPTGLQKVQ